MALTFLRVAAAGLKVWIQRMRLARRIRSEVLSIPVGESQHGHPEAYACRLCLTADAGNSESYASTLSEFANCAGCSTAVIHELVWTLINALSYCDDNWREALQGRLLDLLDLQEA